MNSILQDVVRDKGKKRLLTIDGGGIRGVIAVEVLAEIERLLRLSTGNQQLRLSDWFHFISGCSTGAILATGLSLGMEVEELRDLYSTSGQRMFRRAGWWQRLGFHRYVHGELERLMKERFGEHTTLGSDKLKTLLMVVLKNATTDSPWLLTNNPYAQFNQPGPGCNLDLPLWRVVRASTAAPTFFAPEAIPFPGLKKPFVFIDGGLTPYNNPSFISYLNATLPAYRIGWKSGEDDMLVVSVGTGLHPASAPDLTPRQMNLIYTATSTPAALMFASANQQDMLCRSFGKCVAGDPLDSELGDMIGMHRSAPTAHLFTYARYNVDLTSQGLASIGCADLIGRNLHRLDATDLIYDMQAVGRAVAKSRVRREHFESFIEQAPTYQLRAFT
ncbi:patatin-like phospholipase family protein [Pseudomonas sp. NP21570]|nr:patatin-like phospholipase family protein [Pseudomonas sp. NP21570]